MTSLKNEAVQKLYGSESKWKDKNLKAVFFNKFAPIPYKTIYDTGLESPYVKIPGDAISGDINTALRKAEEDANKRLEDAKTK
ncbi:hypothetical protein [Paenibacillus sp. GYB003]|uniref:hypothetical protein n=1 Tax=Paenibacillus sp. GYB003 TaxID=2994392 RepID=UPI002F9698A2